MGAASTSLSLIGVTVGNYRVVSKLGEGGMGAVYLAEHPLIGKKVALKVLHPEFARDTQVVGRFFNEARAVNEIGHPNIVDVVDYGVVERPGEGSLVYFIMELLSGQSLKALLEREAPLPVDRAVFIAQQIAEALAASHEKGVIHRDLKPDNVFLTARGREKDFVKVLDFGIAKLTGVRDPQELGRTRSGVVMGTPTYMAPEQCEGRRDIDGRADVYSLGVMLYEMVTGKVPFTGEGYGEVILQHITRAPEPPSVLAPGLAPAVEAVILKALEKRRQDRFASMDAFLAALRDPAAFVAGDSKGFGEASQRAATVPSRKVVLPRRLGSAPTMVATPTTLGHSAAELIPQRSRAPVIAASALVVLGILGGAAFFLTRGEPVGDAELGTVTAAPAPDVTPVPPPAAPPEAPAPAVAQPASVKLTVSSQPTGAMVRIGERASGTTPLVIELPRSDDEVTLILELDGYRAEKKTVRLTGDAELLVTLDRAPPSLRREHGPRQRVGKRRAPAVRAPDLPVHAPQVPETPGAPPPEPQPKEEELAKPAPPGDDDVIPPTFGD